MLQINLRTRAYRSGNMKSCKVQVEGHGPEGGRGEETEAGADDGVVVVEGAPRETYPGRELAHPRCATYGMRQAERIGSDEPVTINRKQHRRDRLVVGPQELPVLHGNDDLAILKIESRGDAVYALEERIPLPP